MPIGIILGPFRLWSNSLNSVQIAFEFRQSHNCFENCGTSDQLSDNWSKWPDNINNSDMEN